nr:MAG TPA: hypothetical protein [Caudoviricetes sp.]
MSICFGTSFHIIGRSAKCRRRVGAPVVRRPRNRRAIRVGVCGPYGPQTDAVVLASLPTLSPVDNLVFG